MNFKALAQRYKVHAGVGAAVVVAALAARARTKSAGPATVAAPPPSTNDSTSSDVYNSISPQIEDLFKQIEDLRNQRQDPAKTLDPGGFPPDSVTKRIRELASNNPALREAIPNPSGSAKLDIINRGAPPASGAQKVYVVKPGDTLSGIARKLGLGGYQELYNRNKGVIGGNPNLIKPGQQLAYG